MTGYIPLRDRCQAHRRIYCYECHPAPASADEAPPTFGAPPAIRLVILESPFAGLPGASDDLLQQRNLAYGRACLRDCAMRRESAQASHLLWTQEGVLDDLDPVERALGIELGLAWARHAAATVCYVDFGLTPGMLKGIERAVDEHREIEFRRLGAAFSWGK